MVSDLELDEVDEIELIVMNILELMRQTGGCFCGATYIFVAQNIPSCGESRKKKIME